MSEPKWEMRWCIGARWSEWCLSYDDRGPAVAAAGVDELQYRRIEEPFVPGLYRAHDTDSSTNGYTVRWFTHQPNSLWHRIFGQ